MEAPPAPFDLRVALKGRSETCEGMMVEYGHLCYSSQQKTNIDSKHLQFWNFERKHPRTPFNEPVMLLEPFPSFPVAAHV